MRTIFKALSVSVLALAAAGCKLTPPPTPLDKPGDVPTGFTAPVLDKNAPIWPAADWWNNFNAPELAGLMDTAIKENLDLKVAIDRVLEAEANNTIAFAALLPTVSGSASYTKAGTASTDTDSFRAGLSGNYVLDFFGANRARLKQSDETLRGARYTAANTGLTIEQSVANTYFTILQLRERIAITRQNLDLSRRLLAISQAKFAAGVASQLDVMNETAVVAGQQAQLPGLLEQEREARYTLAVLLGLPPENFDIKAQNLDGITPPTAQAGLPSELLLRRPDIALAEANLYASHANVDAARAAFFPQIGLSAGLNWSTDVLTTIFDPAHFAWSLGASLAQTIFDGGVINARDQVAKLQQDEQIDTYRKTVFTAFQQVEAAVGNASATAEALDFITQQEKASVEAERISELQYREGTIDITTLLNTQSSLFNAQISLVSSKLTRLQNSIALYIALGGGWTQKQSDADYKPSLDIDWFPILGPP
ncbi:MAG: efflux transporter outer membrane subunit [Alphaproteobacteria bacterium]|nr:efflux transporter outer membrane subunit [Alphaproteobacteria bacterium]